MSPDIYLVLADATIFDACGKTLAVQSGGVNGRSTSRYSPGQLSTIHPVPTGKPEPRGFNFGDIPCPPKEIQAQLDPGALYSPVVILDSGVLMEHKGKIVQCDSYAILDPPTAAFDIGWDDLEWGGGDGGW